MSDFTLPSHDENNNAWLNDLLSDIIDHSDRPQCESLSKRPEGKPLDGLDSSDEHESTGTIHTHRVSQRPTPPTSYHRLSLTSRQPTRAPASNRISNCFHSPARSQLSAASAAEGSQRSTSVHNTSSEPRLEDGGFFSLDPFHRQTCHLSPRLSRGSSRTLRGISSPPISLYSYVEQSDHIEERRLTPTLPQLPRRVSSLHATTNGVVSPPRPHSLLSSDLVFAWSRDPQGVDITILNVPSHPATQRGTSASRTSAEIRLSNIQKLESSAPVVSNAVDDPVDFASHPAVRPVDQGEKFEDIEDDINGAGNGGDDDDHVYPGPFALALIMISVCLSAFITSVDRIVITTAIPQITETFRSSIDIGWYGSSYLLAASAFQPLYGRVYTSFDTKWVFLSTLGVFELGSLLSAVSPNSVALILGRAVQGFGSAGILTGSYVVVTQSVPPRKQLVFSTLISTASNLGTLIGPLLGGVFTDHLTWRWAFWINLPVGATTFVAVCFFLIPREDPTQDQSRPWLSRVQELDFIGNAILLAACTMLFLALQLVETRGTWGNTSIISLFCGFSTTTIAFIAWLTYRGDAALVPPRIVGQRQVAASCGAAFFIHAGLYIHAYYLPLWFQAVKGGSAIYSGIGMIPYILANALFSLMAGIFVSKKGLFAMPAAVGTAIATIGCGLLATIDANTGTSRWIGYEIIISVGLGMATQQGLSAVQTALSLEEMPIGTAAVVASQSLGGAIFVSIGNSILQGHLLNSNADAAVPSVDIRAVFRMGATIFRSAIPKESLPAFIRLYNESLQSVFLAAVPLISCAFLCSLGIGWRSVKIREELASKREEEQRM